MLPSSSAVYGAYQDLPFKEIDATKTVNAYGREKLIMEELGRSYISNDFEVCSMRIGNVAGADGLLANWAQRTLSGPLHIDRFEDGNGPSRSYIGPKTFSEVCRTLTITRRRLPAVINIATPTPLKMEELAIAANIPWIYKPAPSSAHQHITLNCSNIALLHEFDKSASLPETHITELNKLDA